MVPLPKVSGANSLGVKAVIDEFFDSGHAEQVPEADLEK